MLLFAVAAIPGSLFIAKLGARRATITGLIAVAIFAAVRAAGPSLPVLFGGTFGMGLAIALIQPGFPTLVRQWFPSRVGIATALYSNGLLVGESAAAAFTLPLVLPLSGGSWELAMAFWSLPALAAVGLLLVFSREAPDAHPGTPEGWFPKFDDPNTLLLGVTLGLASMAYWASNAFIPDYLRATGRPGLIALTLSVLNLSQFPSSLAVVLFGKHLLTRPWAFVVGGVLFVIGFLDLALAPGAWPLLGAALVGFAAALIFVVSLALPALIAPATEVHRLAASLFSITYAFSFVGPVIGGAFWDATGIPATAFLPTTLGAVGMLFLATRIRMPDRQFDSVTLPAAPLP